MPKNVFESHLVNFYSFLERTNCRDLKNSLTIIYSLSKIKINTIIFFYWDKFGIRQVEQRFSSEVPLGGNHFLR